MSRRFKFVVLGLSALILSYSVLGHVLNKSANEGAYRQLTVFSQVLNRIKTDYVDDPSLPTVTVGALHGLLESLDPYSGYLSPREYTEFQKRQHNGKASLGAVFSKRFGYLAVVAVVPGGPAARAGLRTGELIETVEGFSTRDMSIAQARQLLDGQPGTPVRMAVIRRGRSESQPLDLVRAEVPTPPMGVELRLGGASDLARVKVLSLDKGRAEELRNKLQQLEKAGARKLIFDLRDCAAGDPDEAIEVARLFIEKGVITSRRGQTVPREEFTAEASRVAWPHPLEVLIDAGTAGPAEIVAAAVLDHRRGEAIGERSWGIGSTQKLIPLDDGSALILSVAKYYSPAGKAIQENGIMPTVVVQTESEDNVALLDENIPQAQPELRGEPPQEDPILRKAIELFRSKEGQSRAIVPPVERRAGAESM